MIAGLVHVLLDLMVDDALGMNLGLEITLTTLHLSETLHGMTHRGRQGRES